MVSFFGNRKFLDIQMLPKYKKSSELMVQYQPMFTKSMYIYSNSSRSISVIAL